MDQTPPFRRTVAAGRRVYEFEVLRASTGARYLVIDEIDHCVGETTLRGRIMVFEDHLTEFRRAARAAMRFLSRGTRAGTVPPSGDKSYDVASIRRTYPRAYRKWTPEEDAKLKALVARGKSSRELAAELQRRPGAILSRLRKLGFPTPS